MKGTIRVPHWASNLLLNILSGFIGAFFLWFGSKTFLRYRTKRIEKRYTLSGEYLSWYEDPQPDGTIPIKKSVATLNREGVSIRGKTTNLEDGRTWQLDLRIYANRYLVGTYANEHPSDPGLGAVFLETTEPGSLDGSWVGFDPITKTVQSGAYHFSRSIQVKVSPLTANTADLALAILSHGLGEQYITEDDLSRFIHNPTAMAMAAIDPSTKGIVGVVLAEIVHLDNFDNTSRIRNALRQPKLTTVGVLKSISVLPAWQHKGVATRLAKKATEWLDAHKVPLSISLAWVKQDGSCPASNVLKTAGFEPVTSLNNFWTDDSTLRGYNCPVCGTPCRCSAKLYRRVSAPMR